MSDEVNIQALYNKLGELTYQLEVYKALVKQLEEDRVNILKEIDTLVNKASVEDSE